MNNEAFRHYLFQYEQDNYYPLRRIPMIMRMKLDLCGVKLTIGDWSKFSREDREQLVVMPYQTPAELAALRARLLELVAAIDGDSTPTNPISPPAPWTTTSSVPDGVCKHIQAQGMPAPTVQQWAALSDFQRFALLKLTREGHENKKLPLALKEFGLVPSA
jgi:hypothetical protein